MSGEFSLKRLGVTAFIGDASIEVRPVNGYPDVVVVDLGASGGGLTLHLRAGEVERLAVALDEARLMLRAVPAAA